jgi:hypothetical protein
MPIAIGTSEFDAEYFDGARSPLTNRRSEESLFGRLRVETPLRAIIRS